MWKHPNEYKPNPNPVIIWTWNNECRIISGTGSLDVWNKLCQHEDIKWWQHVSEIAPQGLLGSDDTWYGCTEDEITRELWDAIGIGDKEEAARIIKSFK